MNYFQKSAAALALSGIVASGNIANAAPGISSITISGQVPLVCRVSVDNNASAMLSANGNKAHLREFSNNGAGYRVVASFSKQISAGRLRVDGVAVPLGSDGEVVISDVSHAASTVRSIAVEGDGKLAGSIRFRIEPR